MARFVYLMLDGVGVGALPDAAVFGDEGADTLGNLSRLVDLDLPNLRRLGLGNLHPLRGVGPVEAPLALPGRLAERSAGKDTTNGHWEHMGVVSSRPFPTYPHGFPEEVLVPLSREIGLALLGNRPASGTEIIAELGEEHVASGSPIVYTSADSVFQIACHVDVIPLAELYRYCEIARRILTGPHAVARVIARPFSGSAGAFVRTKDRRDFSLAPPAPTYLDLLVERGVAVTGIGKIHQIFAGRGVDEEIKVASNDENLAVVADLLRRGRTGLIFTNLVDFDMAWGHRNDVDGFAAGLSALDRALPMLLALLRPRDRLLITADHGVDPTTLGTDHTREYVPLLYHPRPAATPEAAYQGSMWDTGATVYAHLVGEAPPLGGRSIEALDPERGWRAYPAVSREHPEQPVSVGPAEANDAALHLRATLGEAPELAVVLGSGLDGVADAFAAAEDAAVVPNLNYDEIPGWPIGSVAGHRGRLEVRRGPNGRIAFLRGRVHEYEGVDAATAGLSVRTLARWGVRRLVLTAASGGLGTAAVSGDVAVVTRVLDCRSTDADGSPRVQVVGAGLHGPAARRREAASEAPEATACGREAVPAPRGSTAGLPEVTYVALPGPHYETAAEVDVLRALGGDVVGMSVAAEVQAASEEDLEVLVLTVVTNEAGRAAGKGDIAHAQVLEASIAASPALVRAIETFQMDRVQS